MTIQIQTRRSSLLNDRPVPTRIASGELCVNINSGDPGLFYANAVASTTNTGFPSNPVNGQLHYVESTTTLHIYRSSINGWTAIN
jgi:hypothetical protein